MSVPPDYVKLFLLGSKPGTERFTSAFPLVGRLILTEKKPGNLRFNLRQPGHLRKKTRSFPPLSRKRFDFIEMHPVKLLLPQKKEEEYRNLSDCSVGIVLHLIGIFMKH